MAAANPSASDREFVAELRAATDRYLAAVDAWEAAYRKYYRLAVPARKISSDLEEPEKVFAASRKRLTLMVPRARGLCFKHGLRDVWTGLVRSSLGQYAPQERPESAISRMERQHVGECLILLAELCGDFQPAAGNAAIEERPAPQRRTWLRWLLDFFY
jgi:hypothetical protein